MIFYRLGFAKDSMQSPSGHAMITPHGEIIIPGTGHPGEPRNGLPPAVYPQFSPLNGERDTRDTAVAGAENESTSHSDR